MLGDKVNLKLIKTKAERLQYHFKAKKSFEVLLIHSGIPKMNG